MKNVLIINSSPNLVSSTSRELSQSFELSFAGAFPNCNLIYRDVGRDTIPHLNQDAMPGLTMDEEITTGQATRELSNQLIAEVQAADLLVIAAPMHNFGIPSSLKAYFDHIAVVGKTVTFGEKGLEGVLTDKQALVLTTSGGMNQDTDRDFQGRYIERVLNFVGVSDITFVRAQGLLFGDEARNAAMSTAKGEISTFVENVQKTHSDNQAVSSGQLILKSEAEYLDFSAQLFSPIKEASYELCGIDVNTAKQTLNVLDVGCGVGKDTLAMASRLSDESHVLGIDANDEVITQANERVAEQQLTYVDHRAADAEQIDEKAFFDAVRSERVFQHLNQPEVVLKAMIDATKPGGTVVVVDTDWTSLVAKSLNAQENQVVSDHFAKKLPQGSIANSIGSLFRKAGLTNVKVQRITTSMNRDEYGIITQRDRFFKDCFKEKGQLDAVNNKLDGATNDKAFSSLDSVLVSGQKL